MVEVAAKGLTNKVSQKAMTEAGEEVVSSLKTNFKTKVNHLKGRMESGVHDFVYGVPGAADTLERNEHLKYRARIKLGKNPNVNLVRDSNVENRAYKGRLNSDKHKFDPEAPTFLNPFIHKLPKSKQTDVISKAMPYRFNGWVAGTIVAGSAGMAVFDTGMDVMSLQHARKVGPLSYDQMANHVGMTPNTRDPKFIKSIPADLYQNKVDQVSNSLGMKRQNSIVPSYDDGSAGGDLVFAMHNLR